MTSTSDTGSLIEAEIPFEDAALLQGVCTRATKHMSAVRAQLIPVVPMLLPRPCPPTALSHTLLETPWVHPNAGGPP